MKFIAFLCSALALMSLSHAAEGVTRYKVSTEASKVEWTGKKVTGQHTGTVTVKSGSIEWSQNRPAKVQVDIDMSSIRVLDLTDQDSNTKLTNHLKSDDFFSVAQYPTATFVSTKIEPATSDKKGMKWNVTGDLTIKGKSEPITFPAEGKLEKDTLHFITNLKVDRTKYNVRYGSGKFFQNLGDKLINDEFELKVTLVAQVESPRKIEKAAPVSERNAAPAKTKK